MEMLEVQYGSVQLYLEKIILHTFITVETQ